MIMRIGVSIAVLLLSSFSNALSRVNNGHRVVRGVVIRRQAFVASTPTLRHSSFSTKNTPWYHQAKQSIVSTSSLSMSSPTQGSNNDPLAAIISGISREFNELLHCTSIVYKYLSKPDHEVTAADIVRACDAVDEASTSSAVVNNVDASQSSSSLYSSTLTSLSSSFSLASSSPDTTSYLNQYLSLQQRSHEFGRYHLLVKLLRSNYDAYVSTAEFLSPSRISRMNLPNVQDVKFAPRRNDDNTNDNSGGGQIIVKAKTDIAEEGLPLVPDCTLQNMTYNTSPLDALLLSIFRKFVSEYTQMPIRDDISGIQGLVQQGRSYMTKDLPESVSYDEHANEQHNMVKTVLGRLMTPVLPPFYRLFMSGILPSKLPGGGTQIGPWFYAPFLTSIVTPVFFGFLVGPSYPNRRKDGQRGGLVVEKCKFLQESQCKGLCLHQCKIPAQEFFAETLGLELSVSPNFVTQECQWSFGERPLEVSEDSSFPVGCLVGCESRKSMAVKKGKKGDAICM